MRRTATILILVLGSLLASSGVAAAQSQGQYPIRQPAETRSYGVQRVGDTFTKRDCGFERGSTAEIRLNDTAAGTETVDSEGCANLVVRVVAEDRVSIDGREYAARRCADNSIFVTAPAAGGVAERRQVENRFRIGCPAATALPRTGQDITDLAALGAALTVIGAVVVVIMRRRRQGDDAVSA